MKKDNIERLVHALHQLVDLVLTQTSITTLVEVVQLLDPAATRVGQLEGPQELVDLLELVINGVDLVDDILNADNAMLAHLGLDDAVVSDGDALLVDLDEATLVDELLHGLEVGITVSDVRLDQLQHGGRGLVEANEHSVVDLAQTQEL